MADRGAAAGGSAVLWIVRPRPGARQHPVHRLRSGRRILPALAAGVLDHQRSARVAILDLRRSTDALRDRPRLRLLVFVRGLPGQLRPSPGPPVRNDGAGDHRRRVFDPPLLHCVHGARSRILALLRLSQSLRGDDAGAGFGGQPGVALRGLGRSRALQLPAGRILVRGPGEGVGRPEGVRRQPDRRFRISDRRHPAGALGRGIRQPGAAQQLHWTVGRALAPGPPTDGPAQLHRT